MTRQFLCPAWTSLLCFGSESWICSDTTQRGWGGHGTAACRTGPVSSTGRRRSPGGSVSSVWRPLRYERHEEGDYERPRGGQEAGLGGAVGIFWPFLPTFPVVVRAVVRRPVLSGEGEFTSHSRLRHLTINEMQISCNDCEKRLKSDKAHLVQRCFDKKNFCLLLSNQIYSFYSKKKKHLALLEKPVCWCHQVFDAEKMLC